MQETTKEDIIIAIIAGLTMVVVTFTIRRLTPAIRLMVK